MSYFYLSGRWPPIELSAPLVSSTASANFSNTSVSSTSRDTTLPPLRAIYSCNIRGANCFDRLQSLLSVTEYSVDQILLINETNAAPERIRKLSVRLGLAAYSTWDPTKKVGSGVSILLPSSYSGYARNITKFKGYGISLDLHLQTPIRFLSIYTSHDPAKRDGLIEWITRQFQAAASCGYGFVLGGDFNSISSSLDSTANHSHQRRIDYLGFHSTLLSLGLIDLAQQLPSEAAYTRVTTTSAARIDYVYLSPPLLLHVHNVHTLDVPYWFDHKVVGCTLHDTMVLPQDLHNLRSLSFKQNRIRTFRAKLTNPKQAKLFLQIVTSRFRDSSWSRHKTVNEIDKFIFRTVKIASSKSLPRLFPHRIRKIKSIQTPLDALVKFLRRLANSRGPTEQITITQSDLPPHELDAADLDSLIGTHSRNALLDLCNLFHGKKRFLVQTEVRKQVSKLSEKLDKDLATPRLGIQIALSRTRNNDPLNAVKSSSSGDWLFEPSSIKEELGHQGASLFRAHPDVNLDEIPDDWSSFFRPKDSIDPALTEPIFREITLLEIETALSTMGKDKAPGPDGFTIRTLILGGRPLAKALHLLFKSVMQHSVFPQRWCECNLFMLPKNSEPFSGNINSRRPITLLNTMYKVLMRILIQRTSMIIADNQFLTGASTSVLPRTSVSSSVQALNLLLLDSAHHKRPLYLFLEDKSRAFDSISFPHIALSMRRLRIPEKFVSLYQMFLHTRTAKIISPYGLSNSFSFGQGVPQGGPESPLIFLLAYDIALTRLRQETHGYSIYSKRNGTVVDLNNPSLHLSTTSICFTSFVDDLCLASSSICDLQNQCSIISSFNNLVGMSTNVSKSHFATKNHRGAPPVITINNIDVPASSESTVLRLLGVFFSPKNHFQPSRTRMRELARTMVRNINRMPLSPARFVYLVNHVVAPSIAFLAQYVGLSFPDRLRINRVFRQGYRKILRLPKDLPRAIFHSQYSTNIVDIESTMLRGMTTDILVHLQPQNPFRELYLLSLDLLQHELQLQKCALQFPPKLVPKSRHPWSELLPLLADYELSIRVPEYSRTQGHNWSEFIDSPSRELMLCLRLYDLRDFSFLNETSPNLLALQRRNVPSSSRANSSLRDLFTELRGTVPSNLSSRAPQTRQVYSTPLGVFMNAFSISEFVTLLHLVPDVDQDHWKLCDQEACPLRLSNTSKKCCVCVSLSSLPAALYSNVIPSVRNLYLYDSWIYFTNRPESLSRMLNRRLLHAFLTPPSLPRRIFVHAGRNVSLLVSQYFSGVVVPPELEWPPLLQTILAWSDGSLVLNETQFADISYSVIFPFALPSLALKGRCVGGSASSFHAELLGVALCLSSLPFSSTCRLCLDNQSVVKVFVKMTASAHYDRRLLRSSIPYLWALIREIITRKNLTIHLKWTRGHSTDVHNITADRLASEAMSSAVTTPTGSKLLLLYHRNLPIAYDVSRYLKKLVVRNHDSALGILLRRSTGTTYPIHHASVKNILSPVFFQHEICLSRFSIRTACSFLPTVDFRYKRNHLVTPPFCPTCSANVLPDQNHALHCPAIPSVDVEYDLLTNRLSTLPRAAIITGCVPGEMYRNILFFSNSVGYKFRKTWLDSLKVLRKSHYHSLWLPYCHVSSEFRLCVTPTTLQPRISCCLLCSSRRYDCCSNQLIFSKLRDASSRSLFKDIRGVQESKHPLSQAELGLR